MPGQRVRELIEPLGFAGGKTIVDDYLREIRPVFAPPRTFQRTVYRPGEICQFDLWQPREEIPVGHGQTRQGWVVVACLGYSRAGAGALVFSKQTPELLYGIRRCLWSLGALPQTLVWDRQAGLHASGGRPTDAFAAFCGQLAVGWHFCAPRDPQAKGGVERLQDFMERSFEPGRVFANELDYQLQLDTWFDERANARIHKTLKARPIDRLIDEREVMAPLPAVAPDTDRRWVQRVAPDPYLRFDTYDYSLDPRLVGRRVEVRVDRARDPRGRAGHRRAGLPAPALVRASPHDHRARARPRAQARSAMSAGPRRARGRGPLAGRLRRADRMTRPTTELAHLFRALKAPAAARALPKLAERARAEEWSYEQFIATRAEDRDRQPRQPRRPGPDQGRPLPRAQDAGGVRLRLPALDQEDHDPAPRPTRLPPRPRERRPARPARSWFTVHLSVQGVSSRSKVGCGNVDGEPFAAAAGDVDGFEFAALDLMQHGLAGAAERAGGVGEREIAVGDVGHEAGADVVGEPDPPGRGRARLVRRGAGRRAASGGW